MYYLLIDSYGASLAAFPSPTLALQAYHAMLRDDQRAADSLSVLECDNEGTAISSLAAPVTI
ncbi:hypothetical protein C8N24_0759 [Solirubrobacter pauli]|uniref:Uncharacterized protein n=1 Tax=Solirubrobacter pauli TaxID=166793 RepID=A0A660LD21_9ACTN|nr:hypothetical protein [Solirubrobacter pauli]RKQ90944.1 hypothetical protein C8N24_0759 [Solirubrobacter pauli]